MLTATRTVILVGLLALCACSSSGAKSIPNECDASCQSNVAAADGKTLPDGVVFDYDTSKCSDWNLEPDVVRYSLAVDIASRLGAGDDPHFQVVDGMKKALNVVCKSYTDEVVREAAALIVKADPQWPDA